MDIRTTVIVVLVFLVISGLLLLMASGYPVRRLHRYFGKSGLNGSESMVLGAVLVDNEPFIVQLDEYELDGKILGKPVFSVTGVSLSAVNPASTGKLHLEQAELVEAYIEGAGFYFSTDDLSLNAECQSGSCSSAHRSHFIANAHMLSVFDGLQDSVRKQYTPVRAIRGHVSMNCMEAASGSEPLVCGALISRTGTHRTSTRYASRGGDNGGNVSNFVETEMLVAAGREHAAMVQVRGSMPFVWGQTPKVGALNPELEISADENANEGVFRAHMALLAKLYPKCKRLLLSLLDKKSGCRECPAGKEYTRLFDELSPADTKYVQFDYHAEATTGVWGKDLSLQVSSYASSFFHSPSSPQSFLVRTNCVDCLDRTNAAQSFLAKQFALPSMLQSLRVALPAPRLSQFTEMMGQFWKENADAISRQYAGSSALKTDVTMAGRRTAAGVLRDLRATVRRYLNAHLFDEQRKKIMAIVYGPDSVDVDN